MAHTSQIASYAWTSERLWNNLGNSSTRDAKKIKSSKNELHRWDEKTIKDGKTPTTDKVVPFGKLPGLKSKKSNIDFSLGFVFPGECYELKKDIQNIFDKEYRKVSTSLSSFQQCFNNTKIGALFRNEKNIGDLISKSNLWSFNKNIVSGMGREGKGVLWETIKRNLGISVQTHAGHYEFPKPLE